jgi:hypothetical protein
VIAAFLSPLLVGTWQWKARRAANPDTIGYLDVAGKYAQGHYSKALVRIWSLLYSWLLVPITRLRRESQVLFAHLLQVGFLLAAVATIEHRYGCLISKAAEPSGERGAVL